MDRGGGEEERRGESPSAAIQFNCLMSGHQETFQLITSAVAVSPLVSAPHSSTLLPLVSTALLATSDMYLCLECLGTEFAGEDYISNGVPWPSDITNQHIAYLSHQPII